MNIKTAIKTLKDAENQIDALRHASGILEYDGDTVAPTNSVSHRSDTLLYLSELQHSISTSKTVCHAVDFLLENSKDLDYETLREVKLFNQNREYLESIPVEEYGHFIKLKAQSLNAWLSAKKENKYKLFAPYLEKITKTQIKFAKYNRPKEKPYNVMLDMYEQKLDIKQADNFFNIIKERIVPLIQKILKKPQIDDSFLHTRWNLDKQRKVTDLIMEFEQLDKNRCVCGESEHPFSITFDSSDARITTHYYINNFCSNLFSIAHEGGHALYDLNVNPKFSKTPIVTDINMSIHECQSRFFENIICRSKPFCEWLLPKLKKINPNGLKDITAEKFYKAINKIQPILIRMDADELTYPLHILIRYELEKDMMNGKIKFEELSTLWNKKYKEYLGLDVPNDVNGILQDRHWSLGKFGYFPTYALGSAYGAQLLHAMQKNIDTDKVISSGDITPILNWLKENVWQYGALYDVQDIIKKATGEKFNPNYYIEYLEKKYSEIYDL